MAVVSYNRYPNCVAYNWPFILRNLKHIEAIVFWSDADQIKAYAIKV
jgi:hypothetical protein